MNQESILHQPFVLHFNNQAFCYLDFPICGFVFFFFFALRWTKFIQKMILLKLKSTLQIKLWLASPFLHFPVPCCIDIFILFRYIYALVYLIYGFTCWCINIFLFWYIDPLMYWYIYSCSRLQIAYSCHSNFAMAPVKSKTSSLSCVFPKPTTNLYTEFSFQYSRTFPYQMLHIQEHGWMQALWLIYMFLCIFDGIGDEIENTFHTRCILRSGYFLEYNQCHANVTQCYGVRTLQ